ncbi:MAG TPA: SAM-dependent methyltransferase, partial [Mycobacterium sp.]|nr:SAM-dependent methyltransferase [Mycobacterium sp.]
QTYLADHGWRTAGATTTDLLAQHGLPPIDDDDAPFGEVTYVSAELEQD